MSVKSEVCNEVSQYLELDSDAWLEGDVILAKFHCPFGNSDGEFQLVKDAF